MMLSNLMKLGLVLMAVLPLAAPSAAMAQLPQPDDMSVPNLSWGRWTARDVYQGNTYYHQLTLWANGSNVERIYNARGVVVRQVQATWSMQSTGGNGFILTLNGNRYQCYWITRTRFALFRNGQRYDYFLS